MSLDNHNKAGAVGAGSSTHHLWIVRVSVLGNANSSVKTP